jgi:two-component system phosphate regulon sensor histidine kinase PhoR
LWRLVAINGVAVLAFLVASSGYLELKLRDDLVRELRLDLLARARLCGGALPQSGDLQPQAQRLAETAGVRLTVIAPNGFVLADSHDLPARVPAQGGRPEVEAALRDGVGHDQRAADQGSREYLYVAWRDLERPGAPVVRVAMDTAVVSRRMQDIRTTIWVTVVSLFVIGAGLSLVAARFLVRPIQVVRNAANEIARGNLDASVNLDRRDELGELAGAFNTMSRELRSRVGQLEANRRELSAIMDNMSEGLVLLDAQGNVTLANKAAGAMLGHSAGSLAGRPLWESVRLPEVDELLAALPELKEPRRIWVEDRTNPHQRRVLAFVATPLFDAGRGEKLAVLLVSDATEDQKLLELRQEFVANVSHELKTPLTSISAYVETLLDGAADDPAVRRPFLDKIRVNTSRLTKLVSDILTVSRLESGTGDETRTQLDLNELAAASVRRHAEAAEQKNIRLSLQTASRPAIALLNEEDFLSAVDNLLDNAIAYTPAGGRVDVVVSHNAQGLVIEVKDTGVGIPPEALPRVFERFYRVDKARSRAMGGTGLGLAIVKHVALKHGGRVDAESEVGKGSSFRINLPAAVSSARLPATGQA